MDKSLVRPLAVPLTDGEQGKGRIAVDWKAPASILPGRFHALMGPAKGAYYSRPMSWMSRWRFSSVVAQLVQKRAINRPSPVGSHTSYR